VKGRPGLFLEGGFYRGERGLDRTRYWWDGMRRAGRPEQAAISAQLSAPPFEVFAGGVGMERPKAGRPGACLARGCRLWPIRGRAQLAALTRSAGNRFGGLKFVGVAFR
jgi:hypothetical protein